MIKNLMLLLVVLMSMTVSIPATGHSLGLSVLKIHDTAPGIYHVDWRPSEVLSRRAVNLQAAFPAGCVYHAPKLNCNGLSKLEIQFGDLPPHAEVVLHYISSTGEEEFQVINNGKATISAHVEKGAFWNTAANYTVIGIEHILLGPDHLLFVFGMLLLTGFHHRLIWAVTAFTISHSLSLALSIFGLIAVPAVPVEIIIALSIVFVAREALTSTQTLAKRQPWLVAFLFGLIHGLGFASALSDIGLPTQQEAVALLTFNLGVEAGQLLALFVLYVTHRAVAAVDTSGWHRSHRYASYTIGIAGSFWLAERTVSAIT